jgi:hypothetical protein
MSRRRATNRKGGRDRRGFALIYTALIMVVLIGFVSFAVDVGRVQLAKTELRAAADASARAGASAVRISAGEAQSRAVAYAAANDCLGTPVAVDPAADLEIGRWDRTTHVFTPLSGDLSRANAMRVRVFRTRQRNNPLPLVFAPVIGQATCDAAAVATAAVRGGRVGSGIVGIDWMRLNGTTLVDSYDSRVGPYSSTTAGDHGDISSNGPIRLVGTVDVYGIAHPGPAQTDVDDSGTVTITGGVEPLTEPLDFPPVDANPYKNNNNNAAIPAQFLKKQVLTLKGGNNLTLTAGVYYFKGMDCGANSTLTISGPVTIYVVGDVKFAGTINTLNNSPGNFRINVAGAGTVDLTGTSDIYADVYAPESSVGIGGTHDFYGAVVGKDLTISGTADVHYDEALDRYKNTPFKVFLVE